MQLAGAGVDHCILTDHVVAVTDRVLGEDERGRVLLAGSIGEDPRDRPLRELVLEGHVAIDGAPVD